jgi:hypothetical protein
MSSARAHSDEEKLIRHLRRSRRRVVQRQRRRRILGGAAALAVALGSAFAVASFTGTDLAGAAVTRASSLMELLDRRSPGERTEAQLTKTKARHHVLADHLPAAPAVNAPVELAQLIAPPPSGLIPVDVGAPPEQLAFLSPPQPPGAIFFPPPGGGGGPPGGGPPGGPGSPPGTPTQPPPPAVPEPGTWMTMLAGFGLIGWLMRRRKAQLVTSFGQ